MWGDQSRAVPFHIRGTPTLGLRRCDPATIPRPLQRGEFVSEGYAHPYPVNMPYERGRSTMPLSISLSVPCLPGHSISFLLFVLLYRLEHESDKPNESVCNLPFPIRISSPIQIVSYRIQNIYPINYVLLSSPHSSFTRSVIARFSTTDRSATSRFARHVTIRSVLLPPHSSVGSLSHRQIPYNEQAGHVTIPSVSPQHHRKISDFVVVVVVVAAAVVVPIRVWSQILIH